MPRSELRTHRSRASGSSNDERISSLLRQHYLLRDFNNNGNNSRERFVTPVTAKVFRSFSAPRDSKILLYILFVCWVLGVYYLNSTVTPLTEKTKRAQVSSKASLLVGGFISQQHHLLAVIPRKCTDITACYYATFTMPLPFFSLCMENTSYGIFPSRMMFFLRCFGYAGFFTSA